MQFRFEDILKNMIPGSLIIFSLIFYFLAPLTGIEFQLFLKNYVQNYSAVIVVVFFIVSYLSGYIMDALASWGEYYAIYKVFGTPAYKLFKQAGTRMIFQNSDLVLNNLDNEYKIYERKMIATDLKTLTKKEASALFKLANVYSQRCSDDLTKQKLKEYYYAYIFSRNIFFSVFISSIIYLITPFNHLNLFLLLFILVLNTIFFIRRKDKAYYFSRQILIACTKIV